MLELILDPLATIAVADGTPWWRFFGRLHPMVLHFPIALILMAAVVELALCWRRGSHPNVIASFCLWVGMVFAGLAAWTGWEMAEHEGIAGNPVKAELLGWHRWTGVVLACLAAALCLAWLVERMARRKWAFHAYRYGLWAAGILVCFVGYFGAEMKWGRDYLFSVLRTNEATVAPEVMSSSTSQPDESNQPPVNTVSWSADVEPILSERCVDCHGPDKQKGDLQLVPYEAFRSHMAVIDTTNPMASIMVHRISLPADDPDAMPPKDARLTADQIKVIETWIGEGAHGPLVTPGSHDETTTSDPEPSATRRTDPKSVVPSPFDKAKQQLAIEAIGKIGGHAAPVSEGSNWIDVNLSLVRPPASDDQIKVLLGLKETLVWLNLGATAVTDAGLEDVVSKLRSLHRLRLDRTAIGDRGLASLESLQALEVLNLFGTRVTDKGLSTVEALSSLKVVYLWNSDVTDAGIAALRASRPALEVVGGPPPAPEAVEPPVEEPSKLPEESPEAVTNDPTKSE